MNILEKIKEKTILRVEDFKKNNSLETLKNLSLSIKNESFMFEKTLKKDGISFICEIKKASPSKGIIAQDFPYLKIAKEYETMGADAISVLSEPYFFMGSEKYVEEISKTINIPILRKDFIIDEIQLYQTKLIGASAVLLICSLLDEQTISKFIKIANSLGLSSLVETHDEDEIKKAISAGARIIGVNNRNLKTFEVNINNSINLRKYVPDEILFVSESGIKTREDIIELEKNNVNAVLIGETFMKSNDKKEMLDILRGKSED